MKIVDWKQMMLTFSIVERKKVDEFFTFYSCVLPLLRLFKIFFTKLIFSFLCTPIDILFLIDFLLKFLLHRLLGLRLLVSYYVLPTTKA